MAFRTETASGIVVDLNAQGDVVGIDIDRARERLSLERREVHDLPLKVLVAQAGEEPAC